MILSYGITFAWLAMDMAALAASLPSIVALLGAALLVAVIADLTRR